MTNLLLFLGLVLPLRPLLVPWLAAHSLLCLALGSAFLNYLVLYVNTDCGGECSILLGYAASMVAAMVVLMYCIYLVQDFFDILKYTIRQKEKDKEGNNEKT